MDMYCPICSDYLNDKNSRYLPCNPHHIICLKCLNNLSKFIKYGCIFYCPICKTKIKWPEDGINSFNMNFNDKRLININNKIDYHFNGDEDIEFFIKNFIEDLLIKLQTIKENELKELNKLDNQVNDLINIIKDQRNLLKEELEIFFSNKTIKINELIKNAKLLLSNYNLNKFKFNDNLLIMNIKEMKTKLITNRKEMVNEQAIFKPIVNTNNLEIGRILSPYSDQPTHENSTLFKGFICKSLSFTNDTHYALIVHGSQDRLHNVKTGEKIIKFNAKVTSASLGKNNNIYIMIKCKSNEISVGRINCEIKKTEWFCIKDQLMTYFIESDWIKNNICFIENNNFWIYDDNDKSLKYRQFNQNITDFHIFNDKIYLLFHDKTIECLETKTDLIINYDTETGNKDLSIRLDIINKLINGYVLLTNATGIYLVSTHTYTAIFYRHERIFNYGRILSYSLNKDEIVFCIRTYLSMEKLILIHYVL